MALTYLEIISLLSDANGIQNVDLDEHVKTGAILYAHDFMKNHADIDPAINPYAHSYLSKMVQLCNEVMNYEKNNKKFIFDSIKTNLIHLVAVEKPNVTLTQIINATADLWEQFIFRRENSTTINANSQMPLIFERMAGVTQHEKVAYTQL